MGYSYTKRTAIDRLRWNGFKVDEEKGVIYQNKKLGMGISLWGCCDYLCKHHKFIVGEEK